METMQIVGDGMKKGYKMTNENLGLLTRRMDEIKKRIRETGVESDVESVANELQRIAENIGLFDPHKFFVNCSGLCASSDFRNRILFVAKKTVKVSSGEVSHFDLPAQMNDAEIKKELGDGHIYKDASKFCSTLASMISQQPRGEEGDLITNGNANIFYVCGKNNEVFAVSVHWFSDDRGWAVYACRLVDCQWSAGVRAFSCNGHLVK